jgi:hypothetical protein
MEVQILSTRLLYWMVAAQTKALRGISNLEGLLLRPAPAFSGRSDSVQPFLPTELVWSFQRPPEERKKLVRFE